MNYGPRFRGQTFRPYRDPYIRVPRVRYNPVAENNEEIAEQRESIAKLELQIQRLDNMRPIAAARGFHDLIADYDVEEQHLRAKIDECLEYIAMCEEDLEDIANGDGSFRDDE